MKSLITIIFLFLAIGTYAQDYKGTLRLQGTGVYGFDAGIGANESSIGANLGLEAFLADQFSLNISYTDYFDQQSNFFGVTTSTFRLRIGNLEGRYYLIDRKIKPFLLLGFSYIHEKYDGNSIFSSVRTTISEHLGYNGGAGLSISLNKKTSLIYQTKYQVTHIRKTGALPDEFPGQLVINFGLSYKLVR